MELTVLNESFIPISIIDTFESLIWTDRYRGQGDFEIYIPISLSLLKDLRKDYYLQVNESEHTMIIENINIVTNVEDGNKLIITGRSLESILNRRIVWSQTILNGNLQDAIEILLDENIINPMIEERKIDNFIFEKSTDERIAEIEISAQYNMGDNLYDVVYSICEYFGLGFKIVLDDNNQFVFSLYVGEDRSYRQEDNPYVVFSPDFENIINSNYTESRESLKNVILVAGEGEGNSRKTAVVAIDESRGVNRREMFEEVHIYADTQNGSLTNDQYQEELKNRGKETLAKYTDITAFDGEIETMQMYKYREDYFIGDIVQIANEYGHEGISYISEFIISQNSEGISMYPTFVHIQ